MMNYGCEGLNVVISGGTSGIGLAAAEKFLRDGANVYLLGRSVLRGAMAVQKLLAITERSAFYIPCNVASVEDCRKALQSIGGNIHILVNAAGVYVEQRLENATEEEKETFNELLKSRHNVSWDWENKKLININNINKRTRFMPCFLLLFNKNYLKWQKLK